MWRAYPKKNEDDNIQELELRVKKVLGWYSRNLVFKSIWYTVDNPNKNQGKLWNTLQMKVNLTNRGIFTTRHLLITSIMTTGHRVWGRTYTS